VAPSGSLYPEEPGRYLDLQVLVNNQERPHQFLNDPKTGERLCYVAIEPGETYVARVVRKFQTEDLYLALFVDGLNSLTMDRDLQKCWYLPKKQAAFRIEGWSTRLDNGQFKIQNFEVARAESSLAYELGLTDQIGQITAQFYAVQGQEFPSQGAKAAMAGSFFGTKVGESRVETLNVGIGAPPRNPESARSITIYYAPQSVIDRMGGAEVVQ